jgi:dihydroxyacetone kinase-like protein
MNNSLTTKVALSDLVAKVCNNLLENESQLTILDQAIGDGDHGLNIRNGCQSLKEISRDLDLLEYDKAFQVISNVLFDSMGGAAGALYGSFFQALGNHCNPDLTNFNEAIALGVQTIKRRGRVEAGDKTLLDVLNAIEPALLKKSSSLTEIALLAKDAAQATVQLRAKRGRAAMLGDRSVGHMDPGALSCAIIVGSICEQLEANK